MASTMTVGIHPDLIGKESYSDKWAEYLQARGAQVRFLNLLALDALEQARQCDGVMWRWAHNPQDKQSAQKILYTIEHYLGILVYPDSPTAWHYDEKIAQFYLLQALKAPIPQTWLFWDRNAALAWTESAVYPVIFKLSCGAGSSNVIKVNTGTAAKALVNQMFVKGVFPNGDLPSIRGLQKSRTRVLALLGRLKQALGFAWHGRYPTLHPHWWKPEHGYAYFQEFVEDNEFDTRISIIGDRAFAYRRMNRPGDFRASGSGLFDCEPNLIDKECLKLAFQISRRGGFQSMAYDFLRKDGKPLVVEVSYAYVDRMVHACPGYWTPDMKWVEGHMWPEEAQVEDFLKRIESRHA